jgi:hypothetical protein
MDMIKVFVTTVVALVLFAFGASAQESGILGTWQAEVSVLRSDGGTVTPSHTEITLMFEEQRGQLVQGKKHWKDLENHTGNVAGNEVREADEPFIGEIESDGRTVRMVEIEDNGMMFCRLLGQDELEASYIETSPHAAVWSAVFHRVAQ